MKSKEIKELQNKSIEELNTLATDLRNNIGQLQIDKSLGKVKNVNEKRQKQKDLARVLTFLTPKMKEAKNG